MELKVYTGGTAGSNSYLAIDEKSNKAFIVDAGIHSSAMVDEIRQNGYKVEYLILTHGHGDHIAGVEGYRKDFPEMKVVAHFAEKDMLNHPHLNFSREISGRPIGFDADIYVSDGEALQVGGLQLKFIHTPGHTKGGMCILADGLLFSGDTLFCQSIGRTDFPGGDFNEIADSIHSKLFVLPDETDVLPGHMGPTSIGYEKENNFFV